MKNPALYAPTVKRRPNRTVRELQLWENKLWRLTPALEQAGYRVPPERLVLEGYVQKRIRQAINDRKETP